MHARCGQGPRAACDSALLCMLLQQAPPEPSQWGEARRGPAGRRSLSAAPPRDGPRRPAVCHHGDCQISVSLFSLRALNSCTHIEQSIPQRRLAYTTGGRENNNSQGCREKPPLARGALRSTATTTPPLKRAEGRQRERPALTRRQKKTRTRDSHTVLAAQATRPHTPAPPHRRARAQHPPRQGTRRPRGSSDAGEQGRDRAPQSCSSPRVTRVASLACLLAAAPARTRSV